MNLVEVLNKVPGTDGEEGKVKAILRRAYFVRDNKWLKEKELIVRYKKVPNFTESMTSGYQKTVSNMVRGVIQNLITVNRIDGTEVSMNKLRGTYDYRILFQREQRNLDLLRGVLQANPTWYQWSEYILMRHYDSSFIIKYSSLGSLIGTPRAHGVVAGVKSLEQFENEVGPLFSVLAGVFPAPVGAPTMGADDDEGTEP